METETCGSAEMTPRHAVEIGVQRMKLIGNYLSPFVRRVAISLYAVDIPFELEFLYVSKEPDRVRPYNPVIRIPALVLDDGDVLVESYAILDEIDRMVGPRRALTPGEGKDRRLVMKITAIALASTEKAQWAFQERRGRPEEKVHQPWIDHNDRQALGGLRYLDELAGRTGEDGWLAGTERLSQADITSVVAYTFAAAVRPHLRLPDEVPALARFAARCENLPVFRSAKLPEAG
jgi:glutathione S-transferase